MSTKVNYGDTDDGQEMPWDDLTNAIIKTKQEWKNATFERAIRHFAEIYDIEMDFAKRNKSIIAAGGEMSREEFERWEDAITKELESGEDETAKGAMSLDKKAEAMQNMIAYRIDVKINKTIEAQAGKYYTDRDNELRLAIREIGGVDAENDLPYLNRLRPIVNALHEYKDMTPDEIKKYGIDAYERQRTKIHDEIIRHINDLNRLSLKYGTRTFTPRDFWADGICEKNKQTPSIKAIIHYDYCIVEEYCAFAFNE